MFSATAWLIFVMSIRAINSFPAATNDFPEHLSGPEEFWITADLLNIEWKKQCLTTAYCNEPELKIIKKNSVNGEKSSFSWILDRNFEQLSKRDFVSHWIVGSPQDIELALEVIGSDPTYGFQRSCDQTPATKAFASEMGYFENSSPENSNELGRMIVELRGRCFNATLTVQKHIARCPWCTEIEKNGAVGSEASNIETVKISQQKLLIFGCIGGALWLLTASAPVLTLWLVQRFWKSRKQEEKKPTMMAVAPVVRPASWEILTINDNLHLTHQSSGTSGVTSMTSEISNPDEQRVDNNTDTVTDAAPQSNNDAAVSDIPSLENSTDSAEYYYIN